MCIVPAERARGGRARGDDRDGSGEGGAPSSRMTPPRFRRSSAGTASVRGSPSRGPGRESRRPVVCDDDREPNEQEKRAGIEKSVGAGIEPAT